MLPEPISLMLAAVHHAEPADLEDTAAVLADALEEAGDARAAQVRELRPKPAYPDAASVRGALTSLVAEAGLRVQQLLGYPVHTEWTFVPPPLSYLQILAVPCMCNQNPLDRTFREIRMQSYRYVAAGSASVQTFWAGQCPGCDRIAWSWDQWPRPEDTAAGLEAYRRRVLSLFPLTVPKLSAEEWEAFRRDWDREILRAFGIPARLLGSPQDPSYASLFIDPPV